MTRPWEVLLDEVAQQRWRRLVTHATFVCGSHADAPDLVQEALVSTFASRARFTSADQAEAYVRRAIATRAVDASRRRARERRLLERVGARTELAVTDPDTLPGADVVRALATLAPRERACVVLRQMERADPCVAVETGRRDREDPVAAGDLRGRSRAGARRVPAGHGRAGVPRDPGRTADGLPVYTPAPGRLELATLVFGLQERSSEALSDTDGYVQGADAYPVDSVDQLVAMNAFFALEGPGDQWLLGLRGDATSTELECH